MAKNFRSGIDNVFSPTIVQPETEKKSAQEQKVYPHDENIELVTYNVRYPKDLKKRMKRFCIDHDVDLKTIFIEGAILYMEKFKTSN